MRTIGMITLFAALAACAPPPPSGPVQGAGFDTPDQRREAQLTGLAPLGSASEAEDLANRTRAALGRPLDVAGPVTLDRDNPTISREQDFDAVSAERGIAADAARLEAARQQYQLVTPTELQRPDSTGPNIFAYALGQARPKGTQGAYRRGLVRSETRAAARCQNYRSDDIAQEDFLAAGGPERDKLGLDPDGDGNACGWDPAVVQRLVRN